MTSVDYLRLLRRRWYVVAAFVVLGLCAGLVVSAVVRPTYEGRATLYFSTVVSAPGSTISAYETNLLAQQQVKSISLLVGTERVAQEVVDDLRLPMTAAELIPHLTATSDPDTVVLVVAATDSSPQRAADIANSTGRALVRLTDTINRENAAANLPTQVPTVRAEVIQAAVVPGAPSAGTRTANLLGGLLAGLLVGMAVVLLQKLLDRKVRDGDELTALSAAPAMGTTPRASGVKGRPVAVTDDADGELASAYRQLRVNIGVAMAGSRTLAVVSPGSGDGRSLLVCNLAVAFAEAGARVAILEADLRSPRIGDYLGLDDEPGLAEVLAGTRLTGQVVRRWKNRINVVLAGHDRGEPGHLVASRRLRTVLLELEATHDVVLVDTPAGSVASDVALLGARTEAVLLLARSGRTRKAEVERLVDALHLASGNIVGSVLTMEKRPRFGRRPAPMRLPSRPVGDADLDGADLDSATVRNIPAVRPAERPADDGAVRAGNGVDPRTSSASPSASPASSASSLPVRGPRLPLPVPAGAGRPAPAAPGRAPVGAPRTPAPGLPRTPVPAGSGASGSSPSGSGQPPAARRPPAVRPATTPATATTPPPSVQAPAAAAPAATTPAAPAAAAPAAPAPAAPTPAAPTSTPSAAAPAVPSPPHGIPASPTSSTASPTPPGSPAEAPDPDAVSR